MSRPLAWCVVVLLLATGRVFAQSGEIKGTVTDPTGGVVPGAIVTLSLGDNRRSVTTGVAGDYVFTAVAPGKYELTVLMPGFAVATRSNIVVDGDTVTVWAIQLSVATATEAVVVSASKVETNLVNAPVTMTVLSGDQLAELPVQNMGDALRSVPGVNVVQLSARDINVTARQATGTLTTSQLTLLDGRSLYLDFFGLVLWDFVPTNVTDIKQVEVVRGPASAVWGANALTGVVNIITRTPRETAGTTNVTFNAGFFDRNAGSTIGRGMGNTYGAGVTTAQAPNDRWSYRLSAGYFNSDPLPRPTGTIPVIPDPRDPTGTTTVGGGTYPADATGTLGTAYENTGTSQPKFDARVDQELKSGHVTYGGGVAGTSGTIYAGTGVFDIQEGSTMSYGKMNYSRGALKFNVFANIVDAKAPNLLLADPATGKPIQLDFKTQTYDIELSHARAVGRQVFTYGGNYRRNNFDITLAPASKDRNELGAYGQDEILLNQWRFSLGARVDKFGNIDKAVFSPRLSAMFQPTSNQSLRFSFNRAFRSPSTINNYLDELLATPVNLSAIAPSLSAFPLVVRAVGSELPIGSTPQASLKQESLTAWEGAYTGSFPTRTTFNVAFYVNDINDNINFVQLPSNLDPYTAANPPPGWPLPPAVLTALAAQGIYLPRTAFTYLNLGPIRQKGLELSLDQTISEHVTAFANYSWQDDPTILNDANPFPPSELAFPPTHRFNIGGSYSDNRWLGALTINYTDKAFWSDVLNSPYFGYSDAYTLVNGSFGVKWMRGSLTTSVKANNLLNKTVQQHVFGDLIRRSVVFEVKADF